MGSPGGNVEFPKYSGRTNIRATTESKIIFDEKVIIAGGFSLLSDNGGTIEFRNNVRCVSHFLQHRINVFILEIIPY